MEDIIKYIESDGGKKEIVSDQNSELAENGPKKKKRRRKNRKRNKAEDLSLMPEEEPIEEIVNLDF